MLPVTMLYFNSFILWFILGIAAYKEGSSVGVDVSIVIIVLTLISFVKFEGVF